jgi:RND family efflux transporter MFP subunit
MNAEAEHAPAPRASGSGGKKMMVIGAVAALLLVGLGISSRVRSKNALREEATASAVPTVKVIIPAERNGARELLLPGNVEAFTEAPIHARASGYVARWYVDIGAHVVKGQKLADIEAPEVDQQLLQSRSELANARANEDLAKIIYERVEKLAATKAVSTQEVDTARGTYAARQADSESARANVRRLEQLVAFEKVDAPFDGVITARNIDVGQLVDSGSNGAAPALFRIATTGTLRVFIQVPESSARAAVPGVPVELSVSERPGKLYPAKIVRTANAIDPVNRTLRVEVDLENAGGEILPGAFAQVHLKPPSDSDALILPISALLFRAEGPRVATLGADNKAVLVPVTIGRDFGSEVEITSGLSPQSSVIDSPPDSLLDGQQVKPAPKKPAATPAPKP